MLFPFNSLKLLECFLLIIHNKISFKTEISEPQIRNRLRYLRSGIMILIVVTVNVSGMDSLRRMDEMVKTKWPVAGISLKSVISGGLLPRVLGDQLPRL